MDGRRIVLLTAAAGDEADYQCLYALCEDQTLWQIMPNVSEKPEWTQLPPIPAPAGAPR